MTDLSKKILEELLPPEKEVLPPTAGLRAHSQNSVEHWSSVVLLERAAFLRKLARYSSGAASETVTEYSNHATMLCVCSRDGDAEVHQNFADFFFVLEGRATLLIGGSLTRAKTVALGEMRGIAIEGGTRQELRAGDAVRIPAGVPHQILIAGENTISCFVLKIQEPPKEPE
jgi:mannose-6-phosphate isomerase-like protein (cupin superfamily)